MTKRILAMLLAATMVLGMVPATIAEEVGVEEVVVESVAAPAPAVSDSIVEEVVESTPEVDDEIESDFHIVDSHIDTPYEIVEHAGAHVCMWSPIASSDTATCETAGVKTFVCVNLINAPEGGCKKTKTEASPAKGHNLLTIRTTRATCTEPEKQTKNCIRLGCDHQEVVSVGEALGHNWSDWTADSSDVACNTAVTETRSCSRCKETESRVNANGHNWGAWSVITEASCEKDGSRTRICAKCSQSETETIPATGHSLVESGTKATCEKDGLKIIDCENCDYHVEEEQKATGHEYIFGGINTKEATCTEDGFKFGTCSKCLKSETIVIPALGHDIKSTVTLPTCTQAGYIGKLCTRCDYIDNAREYLPALGHDYKETLDTSTCILPGIKTFTCSRSLLGCSEPIKTEISPAKGHVTNEWTVTTEATCVLPGSETGTCTVCGLPDIKVIPATGHNWVDGEIVAEPTCTEPGKIADAVCSVCGYKSYLFDREIPALGHEWGEWVVSKDATCSVEGEKYHQCTREGCEGIEYAAVPTNNKHRMKFKIDVATCGKPGHFGRFCQDCGAKNSFLSILIPATGRHSWKTGADGVTKCSNCGATK